MNTPWSVVRVHFLHADKMQHALSFGWEPFAALGEFVLLRRLSVPGPRANEFHVLYGEWEIGMER